MSHLLDTCAKSDPQRAADLAAADAEMRLEDERIRADLDYLRTQGERDARRLREVAELERGYFQRAGWLL